MSNRHKLFFLIIMAMLLALAWSFQTFYRQNRLVVINHSGVRLEAVLAEFSGGKAELGTLADNTQASVRFMPSSESGLTLHLTIQGTRQSFIANTYLEPGSGDTLVLEIQPGPSMELIAQRPCSIWGNGAPIRD